MSREGLKLAVAYSYMPNFLGFCGSQERKNKKILKDFLEKKYNNLKRVEKILKGFIGAYKYYKLIAKKNNIKDPFNKEVVEAYWIGNNLLDKVGHRDIKNLILEDFTGLKLLSRNKALKIVKRIPNRVKIHHSFHVFHIGSITGKVELKGKLLDLCRVGWGEVIKLKTQNSKLKYDRLEVIVEYKPLILRPKVHLGKPRKKKILWNKRFLPKVKIGDIIAFHWGFAAQVLNERQVRNLGKYTLANMC